ncbi:MAG: type II secretion system protein [Parcubacteria group bacterium]|nr:type II secretion system protein [Parcubacteria group bacterium]
MRDNSGQILIEVLASIVLVGVVLFGIVVWLQDSINSKRGVFNSSRALYLAEEGLETVRYLAAKDWQTLKDGQWRLIEDSGEWRFAEPAAVSADFEPQILIASVYREETGNFVLEENQGAAYGPFTKRVEVRVYWEYDPKKKTYIDLVGYVYQWDKK